MIRKCIICENTFKCEPSDKKVTCSKPCQKERARRAATGRQVKWKAESVNNLKQKGFTDNLKLGAKAAQASPNSGPFETNSHALIWTIISPEGVTYKIRNLKLWLRKNTDKIQGTPEQARAGFMQMKRSLQGKTKRPVNQWKGWRLVSWEKPE